MIDLKKLEERLPNLRGIDLEQAEMMERAERNSFPDLSFCKSFQARLAAHALEIPYQEIKNLPIKEYMQVTNVVFNFFFAPSAKEDQQN